MAGFGDGEFSDTGISELIWLDDHDEFFKKLSPAEAGYRKAEKEEFSCKNCRFFIEIPSYKSNYGSCKIVDGIIEKDFTCNFFKKKVDLKDKKSFNKKFLSNIISKFLSLRR